MKTIKIIVSIFIMLGLNLSVAADAKDSIKQESSNEVNFEKAKTLDLKKAQKIVKDYKIKKQLKAFNKDQYIENIGSIITPLHRDRRCKPDSERGPSCAMVVCNKLSSWECDEQRDLEKVAEICVGNRNGRCINTVCEKLNSWECNDFSDLERVATMCRGHFSTSCMNFSCSKMNSWECNEVSDLELITNFCKGADIKCMEFTCSKLNPWECDEQWDLEKVAEMCKN